MLTIYKNARKFKAFLTEKDIMWQLITIICLLLCISCTQPSNFSNQKKSLSVTLFYTGELLGELEPCGCSGGKLGGMALRSSWIDTLNLDSELFLIDGGFAAKKWDQQDKMKFIVHRKTLNVLNYGVQFLSTTENLPEELEEMDKPIFLTLQEEIGVSHLYKKWESNDSSIGILFLVMETFNSFADLQSIINKYNPNVIFTMTKGIFNNYESLVPNGNFLRIFFPVDSPAPYSPLQPAPNVLIISAGNKGRYAGLLEIQSENQTLTWQNRILSLEKGNPPNPKVTELLTEYANQVKEERLLDIMIKQSSPVGFIGSENCMECHQREYKIWKKTKHSHAFSTLAKVNHQYDPECIGCHVIGFDYEEGFRNPEDTPDLMNVGCESCHGAGAEQAMNPIASFGKEDKKPICLTCHEKNRSPKFDYEEFRKKIRHWHQENNSPND